MAKDSQSIDRLDPDKLMTAFSNSRTLVWFALALAIHIVVVGGLSVSYIRDTWIDPEGAEARRAALEAANTPAPVAPPAPTPAPAPDASATTPPAADATAADTPPTTPADDPRIPAHLTEAASPDEIPDVPDLGLSIEDTNPR